MPTSASNLIESVKETLFTPAFDVARVREDFPALHQQVNGHPLIYLDTAASCHKPRILGERLQQLYLEQYAKPQETHPMSVAITEQLEHTRQQVADEIKASSKEEIVFVRGCTEGINLVATGFERIILTLGNGVQSNQSHPEGITHHQRRRN